MLKILALALFVICANAQSSQNLEVKKGDTKTEKSDNKKQHSGKILQPSQGLPEQPPAAEKTQQTAEKEKADNQSCMPDTALEAITCFVGNDGTARATWVLVCVVLAQLLWMSRQERVLKESVAVADKAASSALLQAQVSEREFVSTHRPRIILRASYFDEPAGHCDNVPIKLIFINVGDTEAKIIGWDIDWASTNSREIVPVPPLYEATPQKEEIHILNSGAQFIRAILSGMNDMAVYALDRVARSETYYVHGRIIYEDKLGVKRTTGFCRRYDPGIGAFRKLDGSKYIEYEYED